MKKLRKIYFILEILMLTIQCAKQVKKLLRKREKKVDDDSDGDEGEGASE